MSFYETSSLLSGSTTCFLVIFLLNKNIATYKLILILLFGLFITFFLVNMSESHLYLGRSLTTMEALHNSLYVCFLLSFLIFPIFWFFILLRLEKIFKLLLLCCVLFLIFASTKSTLNIFLDNDYTEWSSFLFEKQEVYNDVGTGEYINCIKVPINKVSYEKIVKQKKLKKIENQTIINRNDLSLGCGVKWWDVNFPIEAQYYKEYSDSKDGSYVYTDMSLYKNGFMYYLNTLR